MKKNWLLILILLLAFFLRVPFLDKYPAGLNADEAAIGYNAYSLLQTGQDEHGTPWPLVFRSFDDYKPAGYFYLVLPFVALLGLNVWAVRLPSALLGIISIYLIYHLTNKLFSKSKISNLKFNLGHLTALLLAVSPWHLHFSRGGWEANAASTLMLIGLYFLTKSFENTKYFILASLAFVASLYTYHSLRLVLPFLFLAYISIYFDQIKTVISSRDNRRWFIVAILVAIVLLLPLTWQLVSAAGRSRFSGVSIFADQGPLWEALELRRGHPASSPFGRLLHNKYATYAIRFGQNYLAHYSPRFLFITGDEIARSKVPGMGQAYLWTAPFFFIGFYRLLKKKKPGANLVLSWFLLAPLAAALTFQSPHALRAQNMVYPLIIITAIGLFESLAFIFSLGFKKLLVFTCLLVSVLSSYEFARYLHEYYLHYPKELPFAWQYGFDQIAAYIQAHAGQYDHVIISDRYDQPYILLAFYLKYPPEKLQKEAKLTPRDQFGFSTVTGFSKFQFRRIDFGKDRLLPRTLLIVADEPFPEAEATAKIVDPAGKTMFRLYETK